MSNKRSRTRSGQRIQQFSEDDRNEDLVANVNNGDGNEVDASENQNNSAGTSKNNKRRGKKSMPVKNKKRKSSPQIETVARFIEGGNVVDMSVAVGEDAEFQSEHDNSDEEILLSSQNNNATQINRKKSGSMRQSDGAIPHCSTESLVGSTSALLDLNVKKQIIEETVSKVKDVFMQSGFMETADLLKQHFKELKDMQRTTPGNTQEQGASESDASQGENEEGKILRKNQPNQNKSLIETSQSEVTIYCNAIIDETSDALINEDILHLDRDKWDSSSSEELINTSDELEMNENLIDKFISEARVNATRLPLPKLPPRSKKQTHKQRDRADNQRPSTSQDRCDHSEEEQEDRADKLVREAENAKAKIFQTPGRTVNFDKEVNKRNRILAHTMIIDDDYLTIGSHVEETLKIKIEKGEYVDFAKLLSRDQTLEEEDNRIQMVVRNGQTFWMPMQDNRLSINNFSKWEQAFRVFSEIYTKANPDRASELIQYNHIINTVSLQFVWDNVYDYDKDFRLHMHRHPTRNWSVILQQAWTLRLKDRLPQNNQVRNFAGTSGRVKTGPDICRRFNKGKCTFGNLCKYEHKCQYCYKYGHPITMCRKAAGERGGSSNNNNNSNVSGTSPQGNGSVGKK